MSFVLANSFLSEPWQVLVFASILLLAGIVRGCIGFGFSALIVASTGFWLPAASVVSMVILLEVSASLFMLSSVRGSASTDLLVPLALGGVPLCLLGVWLLSVVPTPAWQIVVSLYLLVITLVSASGYQLAGEMTRVRLVRIGMFSGFFNGFSAMGGLSLASFLVASDRSMSEVRATLVIYFLFGDSVFLLGAWMNDVLSLEILLTALWALVPMWIGLQLGMRLFTRLSERMLRRAVLAALTLLTRPLNSERPALQERFWPRHGSQAMARSLPRAITPARDVLEAPH